MVLSLIITKKILVKGKSLSCVQLLATSWTAAYQAPPSMGFSRQEYLIGLPLPSPKKKKKKILENEYCEPHKTFAATESKD